MPSIDEQAFLQFTMTNKRALQRIANATRGEHKLADVINEAWLMTYDLETAQGETLNLLDNNHQHKLLSYLFQRLVRYTEKKIRNAVRLDHAAPGGENDADAHPLSYLLVSDNGQNILDKLIDKETAQATEHALASHGSLAACYVYLLRHFDNNMVAVADHLRISRSHAYRCRAKAQRLCTHIVHIPIPIDERFLPGPWRSFQLRRPPRPVKAAFREALPLF